MEPEPERWLRVEDAAKYANVSVHYLRGLLRKRELPPLRAGKHFLVDCLDLDRYFEKLKAQRQARSNGDGHLTS